LGRDALGRDVYSNILYGARISLLVGFTSVLIGTAVGVPIGLFSGFRGGRVDDFIMRIADVQYAIPFLVLIIAVIAIMGPGLLNVILFLGLASWIGFARIVRGEVLRIKTTDFVLAARALGASEIRIMIRHILPNTVAPVIVVATLSFGNMIITESALSFLGLGVPVTTPTWGGLLAEARAYVTVAWWPAVFPGLSIFLVVLGVNLFGDWLRDVLDPRLRLRVSG